MRKVDFDKGRSKQYETTQRKWEVNKTMQQDKKMFLEQGNGVLEIVCEAEADMVMYKLVNDIEICVMISYRFL